MIPETMKAVVLTGPVREACIAQDQGTVEGKIVVYMEEI